MGTPVPKLSALGGLATLLLSTLFIGTAEAAHVGCGSVITASTTLDSDIGPCPGDGIIIGADNITLNLNGHEIFGTAGPGDGNQAGIRLPFRTGVSVVGKKRNAGQAGTVRDFDAGVFVNGGSANNVGSLVVRDNIGPLTSDSFLGDGIALFHSARNTILNNVVSHNGIYDGIGVLGIGSNDNIIRGNRIEDTIGLEDNTSAEGLGVIVSHFLDQPTGTGESIYRNRVVDNVVERNFGSGISNVSNVNGVVTGNTVQDNASRVYGDLEAFGQVQANGIGVSAGRGATPTTAMFVKDNTVNRNGFYGIQVRSSGNRIEENRAMSNGFFGIVVESGGFNNEILRNVTADNGGLDLGDGNQNLEGEPGCDNNRWFGNTWGETSALALSLGYTKAYFPDCTATGGSGPNPPTATAAASAVDAMGSFPWPPVPSGQTPSVGRGFSG